MKIRVSIIGATGYTGLELIKILLGHPVFEIANIYASSPSLLSGIHPSLAHIHLPILAINPEQIIEQSELVLLALPHQQSMQYAPLFLEHNLKVIDLSADYRLSQENYESFYTKHNDSNNLAHAVYGLIEHQRNAIKNAKLIANPGCYPTASLLGLLPFIDKLDLDHSIIIDAKSGVSGAGKKLSQTSHFSYINENIFAYSPLLHRHTPEIKEQLEHKAKQKIHLLFVPHLLPLTRGMLVSIYAKLTHPIDPLAHLKEYYKNEAFIRIKQDMPQIKHVCGTNFCDISAKADDNMLFISCAIDNLLRGASAQAIVNANLMFGLDETLAIPTIAYAP